MGYANGDSSVPIFKGEPAGLGLFCFMFEPDGSCLGAVWSAIIRDRHIRKRTNASTF